MMAPRLARTDALIPAIACLTVALLLAAPVAARWALCLASAAAILAAVHMERRRLSIAVAAGVVIGTWAALGAHLFLDHFQLRYVWLYSASELPVYLKLANLWGGDEGSILTLALCCVLLARRDHFAQGIPGRASALIAAWYCGTAAWLDPLAATAPEWLAAGNGQGMNAHLTTVWMAMHAPAVIAAYAWALNLAGPGLDALLNARSPWPAAAQRDARRSWVLLTMGIGFGMIWAFEDATFGQFWHWDPIQTAVFAIWAALAGHLHGVPRWRPGGHLWRATPILAVAAATLCCLAMALTRSDLLASSHRYAGSTSWQAHLALGALVLLSAATCLALGRGKATDCREAPRASWRNSLPLDATILGFALMSAIAAVHVADALLHQALGHARPDFLRPFFETLSTWSGAGELAALRRAYAQWEVDGPGLVRWLIAPLIAMGLAGGFLFLRRSARPLALPSTLLCAAGCAALLILGGPLAAHYTGRGVLSQRAVALLPAADAALLACAFLLLANLAWLIATIRSREAVVPRLRTLSVGLIHGGVMLGLGGAVTATALNSYSQASVGALPSPGRWLPLADGYELSGHALAASVAADGAHSRSGQALQAVASFELRLPDRDGTSLARLALRDDRQSPAGYRGPVRQVCELLDHRYARHASRPGYILHPFIDRSPLRDVQVWLTIGDLMPPGPGLATPATFVVRRYPLAPLLWLGLALATVGGLTLAVARPPSSTAQPWKMKWRKHA